MALKSVRRLDDLRLCLRHDAIVKRRCDRWNGAALFQIIVTDLDIETPGFVSPLSGWLCALALGNFPNDIETSFLLLSHIFEKSEKGEYFSSKRETFFPTISLHYLQFEGFMSWGGDGFVIRSQSEWRPGQ